MTPGDPAGRDGGHTRGIDAVGGDLWSAPVSAQPADDLLAGHLPGPSRQAPDGPSRQAPDGAGRETRPSRRAGRRQIPRRSMSLAVAVAVLVGLGLAAQRLDPSRGAATSPDAVSTHNPSPSPSPSPAGTPGSSTVTVVTGGPPYCPMQADPAGLDCFFIG